MNNEDIELLTDLMLGDSVPKMLSIIHENKKLKKENEKLKTLKESITGLYNEMVALDIIDEYEENIEEL
ncbi:hypothetical protein J6W34_04790 [bacterium]|nr:hypothetical protein [bacterium]